MAPSDLVDNIRRGNAALFVGAGVSMNLGLPSFGGLINYLASELAYDPDIFSIYGDLLTLTEFYKLDKGTIGPLRSYLDKQWHDPKIDIGTSLVHRLIVRLNFPLIYTTNFDFWLERAYKHHGRDFIKIANVGDFTRIRPGVPQIVKLHGDFEDDDSLVFTESSYFDRMAFEAPLDIKLRGDLIGRSILFIGYSLSDLNVRLLLHKLHKQWEQSPYAAVRPKIYLHLDRPNPVQQRVLESRGITPIVSDADDRGAGLSSFLTELDDAVAAAP